MDNFLDLGRPVPESSESIMLLGKVMGINRKHLAANEWVVTFHVPGTQGNCVYTVVVGDIWGLELGQNVLLKFHAGKVFLHTGGNGV